MPSTPPVDLDETDRLLRDPARGSRAAVCSVLARQRERWTRMVALRTNSRLSARADASDVMQAALIDAVRQMAVHERERPLACYPWLHRLAANQLAIALRKRRRRSRIVGRERHALAWPDDSVQMLVDHLVASGTMPGHDLVREQRGQRVRDALERPAFGE
jgi:DNA-directed RNA polymerase specialized sigma24 family protein